MSTQTRSSAPDPGKNSLNHEPHSDGQACNRLTIVELRSSGLPAIAAATATTTTAATATAAVIAVVAATTATTATTAVVVTATAVTTTTATATAAEATATATATAARLALLGLVDAKGATVEGLAIHAFDGLGGLLSGAHRYEREAARTAGLAIGDEVDVADRTELLERSANAIRRGVEREVSYIQTSVHRLLEPAL